MVTWAGTKAIGFQEYFFAIASLEMLLAVLRSTHRHVCVKRVEWHFRACRVVVQMDEAFGGAQAVVGTDPAPVRQCSNRVQARLPRKFTCTA